MFIDATIVQQMKFSKNQIYELTRGRGDRPLPHLKAGKYLQFSWSQVSEWLRASQTVKP